MAQFCSPGAFYLYIKELMIISGEERSRLLSNSMKSLMQIRQAARSDLCLKTKLVLKHRTRYWKTCL